MKGQIYLSKGLRDELKQQLSLFVSTYIDKIAPVFESIEIVAEEKAEEYFLELVLNFNPYRDDPAAYSEQAMDYGYEYWSGMALMQYNTRLMNIATLYQFWEQQFRKFAYMELTRNNRLLTKEIEFKSFCTKFKHIESLLLKCGVDIYSLVSWKKINELHLLQNVIKHGDGPSAAILEGIRPDFFIQIGDKKFKDILKTVLNERVLDVDDSELVTYGDALQNFWDELHDHIYLEKEST